METVLTLKPGVYDLALLLADEGHIPYYVCSKPMRITVASHDPKVVPATLEGERRIEIAEPASGTTVRAPFRIQFHASGYNVSHAQPKVPDTGHFRLVVEQRGKRELLQFTGGETEVWLQAPAGEYQLRLASW